MHGLQYHGTTRCQCCKTLRGVTVCVCSPCEPSRKNTFCPHFTLNAISWLLRSTSSCVCVMEYLMWHCYNCMYAYERLSSRLHKSTMMRYVPCPLWDYSSSLLESLPEKSWKAGRWYEGARAEENGRLPGVSAAVAIWEESVSPDKARSASWFRIITEICANCASRCATSPFVVCISGWAKGFASGVAIFSYVAQRSLVDLMLGIKWSRIHWIFSIRASRFESVPAKVSAGIKSEVLVPLSPEQGGHRACWFARIGCESGVVLGFGIGDTSESSSASASRLRFLIRWLRSLLFSKHFSQRRRSSAAGRLQS